MDFAQPRVEVVLLKKEIIPAVGDYDYPTLRLTGIIRQIGEFSHPEFRASLQFDAKSDGKSAAQVYAQATVRERNGAFTADAKIYDRNAKLRADELGITLKDFSWGLPNDWQKFATFKEELPR